MAVTPEIKRRMKSVSNIKQITRAMQLVATSKMRRAQKRTLDADHYAYGALEILNHLTRNAPDIREHPFWREHSSQKVGLILVTSDRGFCGGLNVMLLARVLQFLKKEQEGGHTVEVVAVGKKGRFFLQKYGVHLVADFVLGDYFTIQEVRPIARIATEDFLVGRYRSIYLAFTQFINTLVQRPIVRQVLPLEIKVFEEVLETDTRQAQYFFAPQETSSQYIFEPTATDVFSTLVPHLLEIEVYKALLESKASEHSSRMMAMRNATDKASELIEDFRFTYNQARQASITKEIAEISAGTIV